MASASSLGWGQGWPNCVTREIETAVVGRAPLRLPVRRQIVPLVAGLVNDLERSRGRAFRADWSWGFACRAISGTRSPSNHSQGCAIDLDAPENPYASASTHAAPHPLRKRVEGRLLRTTMPDDVVAIAKRWGFSWGGMYATKPDPMHFEIALTPLQVAALVNRRSSAHAAAETPAPVSEEDPAMIARCSASEIVQSWYRLHDDRPDGGYGDKDGFLWWVNQIKAAETPEAIDLYEIMFAQMARGG